MIIYADNSPFLLCSMFPVIFNWTNPTVITTSAFFKSPVAWLVLEYSETAGITVKASGEHAGCR